MDYNNYGDGGPPKKPLVAIPSCDSYSMFTAGKRYPVVAHSAYTYTILCNLGHERVISMVSDASSAHLGGGSFKIEEVVFRLKGAL
jgi:hypothetical protein